MENESKKGDHLKTDKSEIYIITPNQRGYQVNIFLISPQKHTLWVRLEVPHWGTSNAYSQHMFLWTNKKTISSLWLKKMSYLELCIWKLQWWTEKSFLTFQQISCKTYQTVNFELAKAKRCQKKLLKIRESSITLKAVESKNVCLVWSEVLTSLLTIFLVVSWWCLDIGVGKDALLQCSVTTVSCSMILILVTLYWQCCDLHSHTHPLPADNILKYFSNFFEKMDLTLLKIVSHKFVWSIRSYFMRKMSWVCHLLNLPIALQAISWRATTFTVITLYWDRQAKSANSVDPDQMPQNAASDQGLLCLPYIQQYLRHINRKQNGLFQVLGQVW